MLKIWGQKCGHSTDQLTALAEATDKAAIINIVLIFLRWISTASKIFKFRPRRRVFDQDGGEISSESADLDERKRVALVTDRPAFALRESVTLFNKITALRRFPCLEIKQTWVSFMKF